MARFDDLEIGSDKRAIDIVAERFDIGVRLRVPKAPASARSPRT